MGAFEYLTPAADSNFATESSFKKETKRRSTLCLAALTLFRATRLPILASMLLAFSCFIAFGSEGRTRLDAATLAQSRGSNPNKVLYIPSCASFNGNLPCIVGFPCTDCCNGCSVSSYVALAAGRGGGYTTQGTDSCGLNMSGDCDGISTLCGNLAGVVGNCAASPHAVVQ